MTVDLYTKAVLTTIAAALVGLVAQNAVPSAHAQNARQTVCGIDVGLPCYIATGQQPLYIHVIP